MRLHLESEIIKRRLRILAWHAETRFDHYRRKITRRLRPLRRVLIQPYLGFGNERWVEITGRVLDDPRIAPPRADSSRWENMRATFKRIASREVGDALLRGGYNGQQVEARTDHEGYFRIRFDTARAGAEHWHPITISLLEPVGREGRQFSIQSEALVPGETAEYGVISDIDDTVVQSNATSFWKLMKLTLMKNAYTRVPFEGVAALYQAFRNGASGHAGNPIFYVSSSAWNVYDLLLQFMEVHQLPKGPLFLRDLGIEREHFFKASHERHKRAIIDRILQAYPHLPFILVGDSGQKDAEIYQSVARHYPERIQAIYIRRVGHVFTARLAQIAEQLANEGIDMQLVPDSDSAARHAVERGFITAPWLQKVHVQKERDEAQTAHPG